MGDIAIAWKETVPFSLYISSLKAGCSGVKLEGSDYADSVAGLDRKLDHWFYNPSKSTGILRTHGRPKTLGAGSRRFKSSRPDQWFQVLRTGSGWTRFHFVCLVDAGVDATPSDPPSWSFQSLTDNRSGCQFPFRSRFVYLVGFLLINLKLNIWNGIGICIVVGRYLKLCLPFYILN